MQISEFELKSSAQENIIESANSSSALSCYKNLLKNTLRMQTNGYWHTLIYFRNPAPAPLECVYLLNINCSQLLYLWQGFHTSQYPTWLSDLKKIIETELNKKASFGGSTWESFKICEWGLFCKLFAVLFYTNFVREQKNSADADFSRLWKLGLFFLASFPGKIFCFSSRVMKLQNFFLPVMMVEKRVN